MIRKKMMRFQWALALTLACPTIRVAYSQAAIDESTAASSPAASLDLSPAQASLLQQALARHDYAAAEKLLLAEIDTNPHSPRAARLLSFAGRVYFLNHDYMNAAIAWKKSDAIAPLDPSAQFSLAMVYIRLGRPDWALPLLQSLASSHPREPLYPYWLGRLDYDAQHYDKAILHFQQALEIDPGMARAHDNLGLCYFYQNNNTLAIESYTKAIESDRKSPHPSPWPHLNLAIALQFLNRLDEAETQLHEALRLDPYLAPAQYQLGTVLESQGHPDAAITSLQEAARLDAAYAEPHYALGRIYRKQGQKALAQAEVDTYQRLHAIAHPTTDPQVH
jgi:tetratricopeptide (TPR) repeat protein